MTTSVILDRTNNVILIGKGDGELIEKLDVDKHIPSGCTHNSCSCKTAVESFFRAMITKYSGRGAKVTFIGDEALITA